MLSLHVDLNNRKVAEFDNERTELMDDFINENKEKFQKIGRAACRERV